MFLAQKPGSVLVPTSLGGADSAGRGRWLFWVVLTAFVTTPVHTGLKGSRRLRVAGCLTGVVSSSVTV